MSDVTRILGEIEAGDPQAAEKLLPLVYDELRKLAAQKMTNERKDHTLQGTALVHEAYLRLVGPEGNVGWDSRGHFFSAAAEAMRRILIDQARRKNTLKAGGEYQRVDLPHFDQILAGQNWDLLSLNDALEALEIHDTRAASLVKLRFFTGLSITEAAKVLEVSVTTANADWTYAKSWLRAKVLGAS